MGCLAAILGETKCINNKKNLSFRQRGEKKSHVFDTTAKQAMWRWRRVATASQSGGKRESEVKVTSGCCRCAENVCCLSSLMLFLENFSMISYCDQLWEGRGRGLKRKDLIRTLDVQIRYNVWSLFATGCSYMEYSRVEIVLGYAHVIVFYCTLKINNLLWMRFSSSS